MTSPQFCSNCGAKLDPDTDFCTSCGHRVVKATEPVPEPPTGPDRRTEGPLKPDGSTPVLANATVSGGGPEPQRRSGNTLALIAGGLGVVVVVALIAFVSGGSSPTPTTSAPPTTSGTNGDETGTTEASGTDTTIVESTGLRELVGESVGNFTLVGVETVEDAIAKGAIDSLSAVYRHTDGTEIGHALELWPSSEAVATQVGAWRSVLEEGGFELAVQPFEVPAGPSGALIYRSETGEVVLWYIADVFLVAAGPVEKPGEFFAFVPYGYALFEQGPEGSD